MHMFLPRKILKLLLPAAAVFYLGYHALSGEQGLYALVVELHHRDILRADLVTVTVERETLERKVTMLRSRSLDPDLLDEQARRLLGVAQPEELVVIAR